MTKLERVIKGMECCGGILSAYECPYQGSEGCDNCRGNIYLDALTLLKAQEPARPIIKQEMDDICSCIDNVAYCGRCGAYIGRLKQNYCSNCGQAVKWDD